MPSSHSAVVTCLATLIGKSEGVDSINVCNSNDILHL